MGNLFILFIYLFKYVYPNNSLNFIKIYLDIMYLLYKFSVWFSNTVLIVLK